MEKIWVIPLPHDDSDASDGEILVRAETWDEALELARKAVGVRHPSLVPYVGMEEYPGGEPFGRGRSYREASPAEWDGPVYINWGPR